MPHISRKSRRNILLFLTVLLLGLIVNWASSRPYATIIYCGLIFAWLLSARRRILIEEIRRYLALGAALLLLLFLLRIFRYDLVDRFPTAARTLWYAYYLPFTAVPLCSLCAALRVGAGERETHLRRAKWLWLLCGFLVAAILTNDLHGLMFHIENHGSAEIYEYGFLYYVTVLWCAALSVASLMILIRRCRLSQCRRLWYIPVTAALGGVGLLAWYFIVGGSPKIGGVKLYNLQEAYAALFIGFWECCIQIGLIPSNTDYDKIFALSHLNAALLDENGTIVLKAADYSPDQTGEDCPRRSHRISGGSIVWTEDHTAIRRVNEELADITETLSEENDLIEQENKMEEELTRYAEQNRLYNKIAANVRPQINAISGLLHDESGDEEAFRARLHHAAVLGAYVKRRANLELLADRAAELSSEELVYAIRETFEYLGLSGVSCELLVGEAVTLSSALILAAYDFFESVIEAVYPICHTYSVVLKPTHGFTMTIVLDAPLPDGWNAAEISGASMNIRSEDDTTYLTLTAGEGAIPC